MKRTERMVLAALAMLGVLAIYAGLPPRAHAIQITQPSVNTIQGGSICSSTPSAGSLLIYDGTSWCGSVAPSTSAYNANVGDGSPVAFLADTYSGTAPFFAAETAVDLNYRFVVLPGHGIEVGNGTVAPTTVINESAAWTGAAIGTAYGGTGLGTYPGAVTYQCAPPSTVTLPASSPTTICTVTSESLPEAPDGSWLVQLSGFATILMGPTAGVCNLGVVTTAQSFATTQSIPAAAYATTSAGGTAVVNSNADLTLTLKATCTEAATAEYTNGNFSSSTASAATMTIIPQ